MADPNRGKELARERRNVSSAHDTLMLLRDHMRSDESSFSTQQLEFLGARLINGCNPLTMNYAKVTLERLAYCSDQEDRVKLLALFEAAADEIDKSPKTEKEKKYRRGYIREIADFAGGLINEEESFKLEDKTVPLVNSPELNEAYGIIFALEAKYSRRGPRKAPDPAPGG